ncbi:RNA-directed DNA polymerase, eukaryota [Tanacetum coccineum]
MLIICTSVGEEKNGHIQEEDLDHVSESSYMKENNEAEFIKKARTHEVQSEDPFEIYDLFKKKATKEATQDDDPSHPPGFMPKDDAAKEKEEAAYSVNQFNNNGNSLNKATKEATQDDDPSHPPGFTPKDDAAKEKKEADYSVNQFSNNGNSLNNGVSRVHSGVNQSFSLKSGGSIMDVIENLVDIRQTMGYNMEGCNKNLEDIVASHGDLQSFSWVLRWYSMYEGSRDIFVKDNATISDSFVAVRGDINEVRSEHERFGTIFNVSGAKAFNHFISALDLIDLPLEGYNRIHRSNKSASKMSKLDRFLVSKGLLMLFPSLSALYLERHLSDHRPIIMREVVADYGPSPFRVYHSWFTKDGFDKLVEESWKTSSLFKGIRIDDSLTLSHLFYADDAVFIDRAAASIIGCSTFSNPFTYLGVKVLSCDRLLGIALLESSVLCPLKYLVSSTRTYIDDLLLPTVGSPTRWAKVVPIKINIFAWKVCLDKLPTRLNLSLRGIDIPSIVCPNCSLAGESCSHLFFSCSMARLLWRKVARWWDFDIPEFSSYEEWITWFKSIRIPKVVKDVLEGVFYVMWWVIWKFRNQVLFGNSRPRFDLLFDDIVLLSFTWCSNRCKNNIDWISWMKYPRSLSL